MGLKTILFRKMSGLGRRTLAGAAAAVWLVLVLAGFRILAEKSYTPVPEEAVPQVFPPQTRIPLEAAKPTLVFFVHAHCPCTRASFHELEALLARVQDRLSLVIVFALPETMEPGWEQGDLWKRAASIQGARLVCDDGAEETGRFGVRGSGHVLLYEPSGTLRFSGGITSSRGHEGDNAGSAAVVGLILQETSGVRSTPVFGCSFN